MDEKTSVYIQSQKYTSKKRKNHIFYNPGIFDPAVYHIKIK